jgi:group I intron endonuclease
MNLVLRQKISDAHKEIENSGCFKTGQNHPNFGAKLSEETRKKISDAIKGENHPMYGQPRHEGAGKPSQQISVTDSELNITTNYNSISEAACALNISHSIIVRYFARNQQKPYKGRYTFC